MPRAVRCGPTIWHSGSNGADIGRFPCLLHCSPEARYINSRTQFSEDHAGLRLLRLLAGRLERHEARVELFCELHSIKSVPRAVEFVMFGANFALSEKGKKAQGKSNTS
jgi:hypothetical protein